MGLLSGLLLLPITGPVRGFRAILEVIQAEVEAEMPDESQIQGSLIELDIRHNTGQIDDDEYEAEQARLMEELNEFRAPQQQVTGTETEVSGSAP